MPHSLIVRLLNFIPFFIIIYLGHTHTHLRFKEVCAGLFFFFLPSRSHKVLFSNRLKYTLCSPALFPDQTGPQNLDLVSRTSHSNVSNGKREIKQPITIINAIQKLCSCQYKYYFNIVGYCQQRKKCQKKFMKYK